jgi:hypothetical protein
MSWRGWYGSAFVNLPAALHGRIIHSYNPGDYALGSMRLWSHVTLQNHYDRRVNGPLREPRNLASKPGLLRRGHRRFLHLPSAIEPAVGAGLNPLVGAADTVNARDYGWEVDAHSDFYTLMIYEVSPWYHTVFADRQGAPLGVQR